MSFLEGLENTPLNMQKVNALSSRQPHFIFTGNQMEFCQPYLLVKK